MGTNVESVTVYLEHDIDEQYQYAPGELLRGRVSLEIKQRTLIRKIFVTIHGEGVVAWEDARFGSFQAKEEYINVSQIVREHKAPNLLELKQGFHEFPFEYHLPENLPSSFIGKFGSVTYVLKGTVNGEKPGDTSITSEPFLILRRLAKPEQCNSGARGTTSKRYWGTCSFGKIKITANLDQVGGTQGDDVFLNAEILNKSPARVTAIQASLIMNSLYHAKKRAIPFRQIVNKRRDEQEINQAMGRRWENIRLTIPPYIPETRLEYCDLIDISYTIQFRIEITGSRELLLEFPYFIATTQGEKQLASEKNRVFNNRQWNMSSRELQLDDINLKHPAPDYDKDGNEWYGDNVPELRDPSTSIRNPLFEGSRKRNGSTKQPTIDEVPEVMESTQL